MKDEKSFLASVAECWASRHTPVHLWLISLNRMPSLGVIGWNRNPTREVNLTNSLYVARVFAYAIAHFFIENRTLLNIPYPYLLSLYYLLVHVLSSAPIMYSDF